MKNVEGRIIWNTILLFVGAILITLSEFLGMIDTLWSGMGIGFLIISILRFIQIVRYKNNADYAKKITVQNVDERNQFVATKARSNTFYYSVLFECVAVILLYAFNMSEMAKTVSMVLCGQLLVYWVSYFILKSKY